ncbi:mannose-6-phosphate isomerase, class I [Actinokineospora sp. HUAS TT18]|uniref:mannose-6-phosphate isomerase, class I n=1 Tax=Actinokineospora sp. HUAS TT18 TaxID=3447451 RepID=UPI003F51C3FF
MNELFRLDNPIRTYDWGSHTVLAELLGRPSPAAVPEAELWIGAHPSAPSILPSGASLLATIADDPPATIGGADRLPFLLKVLAVERPLSIQVHPDDSQARDGFARDELTGLAPGDPKRNYHDSWPKPELLYALTPFDALCGFAEPEKAAALLTSTGGARLRRVAEALAGGPETAFILLGVWPREDRAALVDEVRASTGDAPELVWARRLAEQYPDDPGVVTALLMNLVTLAPGEALFARPRTIHAYLRGTGVEIMANSDNVLRGGLTSKHIDRAELRTVTDFAPSEPELVLPVAQPNGEELFPTPATQFQLSRISRSVEVAAPGPGALLCVEGEVTVERGSAHEPLRRGEALFIPAAGGPLRVNGTGLVFRAAVPS